MEARKTWALVTGASGGLGEAFAHRLAAEGWNLVLVARNRERIEAVAARIRSVSQVRVETILSDLSGKGATARLHGECVARGFEIDVLVNNAGSGVIGQSVALAADRVADMLSLNILALTELCNLFGQDMKSRGHGRILNVSSLVGKAPMPYFASYAASKSYVLSFSLALRAELARDGVVVSCILPGYIRTGFDGNAGIESPAYLSFSDRNAMEADEVARLGLAALARGRGYAIAGFMNRIAAFGMALLPQSRLPFLTRPFLESLLSGRKA